jgi:hypothetical protein
MVMVNKKTRQGRFRLMAKESIWANKREKIKKKDFIKQKSKKRKPRFLASQAFFRRLTRPGFNAEASERNILI